MYFVVPIAVEFVPPEANPGEFLVVNLGPRGIDPVVDFGVSPIQELF